MAETVEKFLDDKGFLRIDKSGNPATRDLCISTAALLVRMAMSDNILQDSELDSICRSLNRHFELTDAEAGDVIEVADFLVRDKSTVDNFIKLVNERLEKSQKITLVALLWKVMMADGLASEVEAHFAVDVTKALQLSNGDVVKAKRMVQHGEV